MLPSPLQPFTTSPFNRTQRLKLPLLIRTQQVHARAVYSPLDRHFGERRSDLRFARLSSIRDLSESCYCILREGEEIWLHTSPQPSRPGSTHRHCAGG